MKIGDSVYTPRFCTVRIKAIFATEAEARAAGFCEPTYYEGKLMNLPANRGLRDENGQMYDIVFGTFFLCGAPPDSDHFTSLTTEQTERYEKRFHTPEMFLGMDGHIVCLPLDVD